MLTTYIPDFISKFESKYGNASLSKAYIPNLKSFTSPLFISLSNTGFTILIGIAKPIDSASD